MSETNQPPAPSLNPYIHFLNAACRLMDGTSTHVKDDWAVVENQFGQWSRDADTHALKGIGEQGVMAKGSALCYREILNVFQTARQTLAQLETPPPTAEGET